MTSAPPLLSVLVHCVAWCLFFVHSPTLLASGRSSGTPALDHLAARLPRHQEDNAGGAGLPRPALPLQQQPAATAAAVFYHLTRLSQKRCWDDVREYLNALQPDQSSYHPDAASSDARLREWCCAQDGQNHNMYPYSCFGRQEDWLAERKEKVMNKKVARWNQEMEEGGLLYDLSAPLRKKSTPRYLASYDVGKDEVKAVVNRTSSLTNANRFHSWRYVECCNAKLMRNGGWMDFAQEPSSSSATARTPAWMQYVADSQLESTRNMRMQTSKGRAKAPAAAWSSIQQAAAAAAVPDPPPPPRVPSSTTSSSWATDCEWKVDLVSNDVVWRNWAREGFVTQCFLYDVAVHTLLLFRRYRSAVHAWLATTPEERKRAELAALARQSGDSADVFGNVPLRRTDAVAKAVAPFLKETQSRSDHDAGRSLSSSPPSSSSSSSTGTSTSTNRVVHLQLNFDEPTTFTETTNDNDAVLAPAAAAGGGESESRTVTVTPHPLRIVGLSRRRGTSEGTVLGPHWTMLSFQNRYNLMMARNYTKSVPWTNRISKAFRISTRWHPRSKLLRRKEGPNMKSTTPVHTQSQTASVPVAESGSSGSPVENKSKSLTGTKRSLSTQASRGGGGGRGGTESDEEAAFLGDVAEGDAVIVDSPSPRSTQLLTPVRVPGSPCTALPFLRARDRWLFGCDNVVVHNAGPQAQLQGMARHSRRSLEDLDLSTITSTTSAAASNPSKSLRNHHDLFLELGYAHPDLLHVRSRIHNNTLIRLEPHLWSRYVFLEKHFDYKYHPTGRTIGCDTREIWVRYSESLELRLMNMEKGTNDPEHDGSEGAGRNDESRRWYSYDHEMEHLQCWFDRLFLPNIHYLPVKNPNDHAPAPSTSDDENRRKNANDNENDLIEKVKWARANDGLVRQMVNRTTHLAREVFDYENGVMLLEKILEGWLDMQKNSEESPSRSLLYPEGASSTSSSSSSGERHSRKLLSRHSDSKVLLVGMRTVTLLTAAVVWR